MVTLFLLCALQMDKKLEGCVNMNSELKQYIKDNIQLVDSYEYERLYVNLKTENLRSELTEFLLECDVKPDDYMKMLPSYYLYFLEL